MTTTRQTCTDCNTPIPNGQAFIRTIAFEQVAFCGSCWGERTGQVTRLRFARPFSQVMAKVRRHA